MSVLMDGHVPPCSQLLACRWDLVHHLCGLLPLPTLSAESLVTGISLMPSWRVIASHLSAVISVQLVLCNENQNLLSASFPVLLISSLALLQIRAGQGRWYISMLPRTCPAPHQNDFSDPLFPTATLGLV